MKSELRFNLNSEEIEYAILFFLFSTNRLTCQHIDDLQNKDRISVTISNGDTPEEPYSAEVTELYGKDA